MPLVKISILDHWSDQRISDLNIHIHTALVESLNIPEWDYFHRIEQFTDSRFTFPDFKSKDFMIIEIHLFPGRSDEQKAEMYSKICSRLEIMQIKAEDIFIQILEQPDINWGIAGKPRNYNGNK